jgi:hypothetical protein
MPDSLAQAVLDREQKLDAAGAGADQRHGAAPLRASTRACSASKRRRIRRSA